MFKPTFSNVLWFLFTKYIVFYFLLMILNNDYRLLEWENLKGGHTITYFILVMSPYLLINMLLFSAPVYFSFRLMNAVYFILAIGAIIVAEYFVYLLYTSENHVAIRGVYNGAITLLFFILFFFKSIRLILKQKHS